MMSMRINMHLCVIYVKRVYIVHKNIPAENRGDHALIASYYMMYLLCLAGAESSSRFFSS